MKKDQFVPLDQNEIEIIENLTSKGCTQRQIQKITWHGRWTIRKYQRLYLERKRIAEKLEKAMEKYYGKVTVYEMGFPLVVTIIFSIFILSMLGLYFLVNL